MLLIRHLLPRNTVPPFHHSNDFQTVHYFLDISRKPCLQILQASSGNDFVRHPCTRKKARPRAYSRTLLRNPIASLLLSVKYSLRSICFLFLLVYVISTCIILLSYMFSRSLNRSGGCPRSRRLNCRCLGRCRSRRSL